MGLKVCLVHGFCGNRIEPLAKHLGSLLEKEGFSADVSTLSVWDKRVAPQGCDLVLQVLSVFSEKDTGCPVVNAKKLLADFSDRGVTEEIHLKLKTLNPKNK